VAVVALCALLGAHAVVTRPSTPFTAPDTTVYLEGSPLVPIGYPLFLQFFGPSGAAIVQPIAFAAALAALGLELLALLGTVWPVLAVLAGIVLIPDVMTFHASLLTESLFISGLITFLAATTRFARQPSTRTLIVAAALAGLTATVRRTAYGFVPALLVMMVWLWRVRGRASARVLSAGLLPLVTVLAADWSISTLRHGDASTSLMGRHLFAKAALIEAPRTTGVDANPVHQQLRQELETSYAPIRELLRRAPSEVRASVILYYETCLQGPCVTMVRDSLDLSEADINKAFSAVARERILRAPWDFVALTATHYVALWTAYKLQHPEGGAKLSAFLAAERPLPFEREVFKVRPDEPIAFAPRAFVRWLQPVLFAIGVFTAVTAAAGAIGAITGKVSAPLLAASLCGLTAHASLLFTAAGAAGIARFMIALLPAIIVATVTAGWWLLQKQLGRPHHARYD
jgi:hypothetical protein